MCRQRPHVVALGVVLALGACAAPEAPAATTEDVVVCARGATVQGIDVSSWQGAIDWGAVASSGIQFAIVRIGDGYYHDSYFGANWDGARSVGLIRGAYQYFEPGEDPIAQADIVVAAVGRLGPGDLPVTCDVEAPSPGVSPGTYTARLHAWADRVEAGTGMRPIIYTGRYYWDPFVASSDFAGYPLWHAQYTSASCPNINDRWSTWTFWQYTSSGSIPGIGGNVDRNVYNGSIEELRTFAASSLPDDDGDGVTADRDCDDHDARRFPGNPEVCDGVDNDCNGAVDDGLVRACGTDVGECVAGTQTCRAGDWGACEGSVDPVPEICDGLDNDCNGVADDHQVCELEEAMLGPAAWAPTLDSDVDGDGRADACARTSAGLSCVLATGHGFENVLAAPSSGGADVLAASRVRLADVDGDGRADVCTRDGAGLACHLSTGHGFDRVVTLPALADAAGFGNVIYWGTLRFGDVDGDGRTDVCARDTDGIDCWLSEGERFGARVRGPRWSDAAGFDQLALWSTIRLGDVDGDGRADLCARTPSGFTCVRSQGTSFGDALAGPMLPNTSGWSDASVYTTLRMADLDGDGRADLCARERDGAHCWLAGAHGFDREVLGPALSDAHGWSGAAYYRSLRLADVDGDGRADLCARANDGLRCYLSTGGGFDRVWLLPGWADASGLDAAAQAATIRIAGGRGVATPPMHGNGGCSVAPGTGGTSALPAGIVLLLATARRRRR